MRNPPAPTQQRLTRRETPPGRLVNTLRSLFSGLHSRGAARQRLPAITLGESPLRPLPGRIDKRSPTVAAQAPRSAGSSAGKHSLASVTALADMGLISPRAATVVRRFLLVQSCLLELSRSSYSPPSRAAPGHHPLGRSANRPPSRHRALSGCCRWGRRGDDLPDVGLLQGHRRPLSH